MSAKSYLKHKSDELGQELKIYASGSGSLSFIWQYRSGPGKGNASSEKVTFKDALSLYCTKDDGHYETNYDLIELFGQYHIVQPVENVMDNIYRIKGQLYSWHENDSKSFGFTLMCLIPEDFGPYETLNISLKSSLKFWLENSKDWKVVSKRKEIK